MKRAYIDLETTGLFAYKNGVTQIAMILEIDDTVVGRHDLRVRPFPEDTIDPRALEVQGRSEAEVMEYPAAPDVMDELSTILGSYVNKYDKDDKFVFLAYNSRFDEDFLRQWFKKCGDKFFGSWFWNPAVCVMQLSMHHLQEQRANFPNFKLGTVCKALGISTEQGAGLHDAASDIDLTYKLYKEICKYTKWED